MTVSVLNSLFCLVFFLLFPSIQRTFVNIGQSNTSNEVFIPWGEEWKYAKHKLHNHRNAFLVIILSNLEHFLNVIPNYLLVSVSRLVLKDGFE